MRGPRDLATETDGLEDLERHDAGRGVGRYLLVCEGGRSRLVELSEGTSLIIGRGAGADVELEDAKASRRHARLTLKAGVLEVADLGSRNGTRLNGAPLTPEERVLAGGDLLQIGGAELIVATAGGHPPLAAAPGEAEEEAQVGAGIVVADPAMAKVFTVARRLASVQTNVLILGETGSGKEVVAQQLHAWSSRAAARFVRLNCASLPETLLESELFGHERGAFTGADRQKRGFFEAADAGTLFLDEIGELSLAMQAKLLSVLENRAVMRLGSTEEIEIDVRVLCATHRDLEAAVETGAFRRDLYYRISTFQLQIPPLRERPREISLLARLFARDLYSRLRAGSAGGVPTPELEPGALAALERHTWPGNVRELRNAIEHAVVLCEDGVLREEHLPEVVRRARRAPPEASDAGSGGGATTIKGELGSLERRRIEEALAAEGGNQTRAAERLGMSRRTLVSKLSRWRRGD